jgi:hypothetical protein
VWGCHAGSGDGARFVGEPEGGDVEAGGEDVWGVLVVGRWEGGCRSIFTNKLPIIRKIRHRIIPSTRTHRTNTRLRRRRDVFRIIKFIPRSNSDKDARLNKCLDLFNISQARSITSPPSKTLTASFIAFENDPPRLTFATSPFLHCVFAFLGAASFTMNSKAFKISESVPLPSDSSTLTLRMCVFLATP